MNIIDIVKNAPEGATHYGVSGSGAFYYYKEIKSTTYQFHSVRDGRPIGEWGVNWGNPCSEVLPLPKLKTDWVKVEDSMFYLAPDLKAGELYFDWNGDESEKQIIKTESELVFLRSMHHSIYRKVETLIDEKQEYLDEFDRVFKIWHNADTYTRSGNLAEFFYGHGFRFAGSK